MLVVIQVTMKMISLKHFDKDVALKNYCLLKPVKKIQYSFILTETLSYNVIYVNFQILVI